MEKEIQIAAFDFTEFYGIDETREKVLVGAIQEMRAAIYASAYLKKINYQEPQFAFLAEFTAKAANFAYSMGARMTVTGCATRSTVQYAFYMPHRAIPVWADCQFSSMKDEIQAMEIGPVGENECFFKVERPLFLKTPSSMRGIGVAR